MRCGENIRRRRAYSTGASAHGASGGTAQTTGGGATKSTGVALAASARFHKSHTPAQAAL